MPSTSKMANSAIHVSKRQIFVGFFALVVLLLLALLAQRWFQSDKVGTFDSQAAVVSDDEVGTLDSQAAVVSDHEASDATSRSRVGGDVFLYSRPGLCSFSERRATMVEGCSLPQGQQFEQAAQMTGEPLVDIVVNHQRGIMLCQQYPVSMKGLARYFPTMNLDTNAEIQAVQHPDIQWDVLKSQPDFIKIKNIHPRDVMDKYANFSKVIFMMHPLQRIISIHDRLSRDSADPSDVTSFINDVITNTANEELLSISRRCRPCAVKYDYVMKVESFDVDVDRLDKDIGMPQFGEQLPEAFSTEKILRNFKYDSILQDMESRDPSLFQKLTSAYDLDMTVMGYSWSEGHSDCVHGSSQCC